MQNQSLKIERASISEVLSQSKLLKEHWSEIIPDNGKFEIDLDYNTYYKLEDAGLLITLVAKLNDNVIGYSVSILARHLHYNIILCDNDMLFIQKDYRSSGAGLKIMKLTEKAAKEAGANFVIWHAQEGTILSKILERAKKTSKEQVFLKEL